MRIRKALVSTIVSMMFGIFFTPPAKAQTFLQSIFGGASQAQPAQSFPQYRQTIPPHRFTRRYYRPRIRSEAEDGNEPVIGPPDSGGPYRTVCVRACDGYYFPLRGRAKRKNFAADVKSCRNACGTDARLFYSPANSPEGADALVDLAGRKYSELPHAFAYRKALVEGCACKPVPWSYEEAQRHQSYAAQEEIEKEKDRAFLAALAAKDAAKKQASGAAPVAEALSAPSLIEAKAGTEVYGPPAPETVEVEAAASAADTPQPAQASTATATTAASRNDEKSAVRRRNVRLARPQIQRARYMQTSAGGSIFGKSKYVWPGDR